MKSLERKSMDTESKLMRLRVEIEWDRHSLQGHTGTSRGDRNTLKLGCGDGGTTL